jgi:hypothetical protein
LERVLALAALGIVVLVIALIVVPVVALVGVLAVAQALALLLPVNLKAQTAKLKARTTRLKVRTAKLKKQWDSQALEGLAGPNVQSFSPQFLPFQQHLNRPNY